MKTRPEVGQILYSLNIGNAARNAEQKLTEVEVVSIGRKYFTVKRSNFGLEAKYHLDDWAEKTDYSPTSRLYESKIDYEDDRESKEICKMLSSCFEYGRNRKDLSIEDLRKIREIINHAN